MDISGKEVSCLNRLSVPKEGENILDDTNLRDFIKEIEDYVVYFRDPIDCPFARGNWIIDIKFKDGEMFCMKLPKEMDVDQVMDWVRPLHEALKKVDLH
jgi:hypothetical protein